MDGVRIWGRPTSTCTGRTLWALAEAGEPYELTLASNFMGPGGPVAQGHAPYGIVDTPEYLARNPNGTIPTIEDRGFVLWDSIAILIYLASKTGPLQLHGPQALASAVQWMSWTNEHLEPPLHTLVMHIVRLPAERRDPAAVADAIRRIQRPLAIMDAHLAGQAFMTGEQFSVGDIPAGVAYHRWRMFELDAPAHRNVDAWYERLKSRPGFRQHVAPPEFHLAGR